MTAADRAKSSKAHGPLGCLRHEPKAYTMQTLFQQESNPGDKPMHIMCAVDGSEFSEWAVQFLEALADRPPQIVTLVHVVDASSIKQGFTGKAAPRTGSERLWTRQARWCSAGWPEWRKPVCHKRSRSLTRKSARSCPMARSRRRLRGKRGGTKLI